MAGPSRESKPNFRMNNELAVAAKTVITRLCDKYMWCTSLRVSFTSLNERK